MAIKYVKGDLLEANHSLIVHQVNCQGVMGSGVALAIKNKYPVVYDEYMRNCAESSVFLYKLLGTVQFIEVSDGKEICNLFGQDRFLPRTKRHTSYDALVNGFEQIKKVHKGDIAMPKIGCGLGGGDWKIVSAIIKSVFDDRDVYVYTLE